MALLSASAECWVLNRPPTARSQATVSEAALASAGQPRSRAAGPRPVQLPAVPKRTAGRGGARLPGSLTPVPGGVLYSMRQEGLGTALTLGLLVGRGAIRRLLPALCGVLRPREPGSQTQVEPRRVAPPGEHGPGSHRAECWASAPVAGARGGPGRRGAPLVGCRSPARKPRPPRRWRAPPGSCAVAAHSGCALPSPPLPAPTGAHCSLVPCQPGASRCPLAPAGAAGTFSQVTCAVVLPSLPTNSDVPVSPWQREVAWDAHTMSRGAAGRHRAGHSQEPPGDSGLCRVLPDATGSRARDTGTGEGCHDLLPSARARLQVGGRRQLASPLGGCFQPSPYGQTPAVPPGSGEGSPR